MIHDGQDTLFWKVNDFVGIPDSERQVSQSGYPLYPGESPDLPGEHPLDPPSIQNLTIPNLTSKGEIL